MAEIIGNAGDNFLFGTVDRDSIYGDAGDDAVFAEAGDDFCDGGLGRDVISAGLGNDVVAGGEGNDGLLGGDGNDLLDGVSGDDTLYGEAGNDTLSGGEGNDVLNGQAGIDSLIGGSGDDTYVLSDRADRVFEAPNGGNDTVETAFAIRLPREIENLRLVGDRPLTARGNNGSNTLSGNIARNRLLGLGGSDRLLGFGNNDTLVGSDGNDELYGGQGRDTLNGGAGRDRFCFTSRREGRDRIADFAPGSDTIGVSRSAFGRDLRSGRTINSDQFRLGSGAADQSDRFIYDSGREALYFDPDGSGGLRQIEIASLAGNLDFTYRNIVVIP